MHQLQQLLLVVVPDKLFSWFTASPSTLYHFPALFFFIGATHEFIALTPLTLLGHNQMYAEHLTQLYWSSIESIATNINQCAVGHGRHA
jgi:hypothetical protein